MIGRAHPTAIRYSLGGLLGFGAVNAFGGGYYGPGYVSWMQPTTAIAGMLVLVLGSLLPQSE